MHQFPADYTTLTEVRSLKGMETADTGDNPTLQRFIRTASRLIDMWTTRHFVPFLQTRRYAPGDRRNTLDLALDDDLLEVTTLTSAGGTVITSDQYNLRPDNVFPKWLIELKSSGTLTWDFDYREDRVQVAGVWGYHTNYAAAWGSSGDTVQSNPLAANGTSLTVTDADGLDDRGATRFEVGDYLKIGATNDFAKVTVINTETNVLTILRGMNGATAAEHAQGTAIRVYRQLDDVRFMANEIVKWLYDNRETVNVGVQLLDQGVIIARELPDIKAMAAGYVPVTNILAV